MAAGLFIRVDGLEKLLAKLDPKKLEATVRDEFNAFGEDVVRDAKTNAPTDEGHLKGAISYKQVPNGIEITVGVDYAAYVEFGTNKFAASYVAGLPSDWQAFAAKYKGAGGGSFEEFVMRIFLWIKRKGLRLQPKQFEQGDSYTTTGRLRNSKRKVKKRTIEEGQQQLAYVIARHILLNGIKAQPFLYPAVEKNMILLTARLKDVILDD